jgi:DNA-binding response OmpR family regulator
MRILLIEDNAELAQAIKSSLEQEGYGVDVAGTADEGDEFARVDHHDAIILDVMLPDRHGVGLCRQLRRQKVKTPILMLTVLNSTEDKVAGLDAGADDYLTKPFELNELMARLRSLLRRNQASEDVMLRSGKLEMNLLEHKVSLGGVPLKVSAKEFALLEYLMRHPGRVLSKTMILSHVWGYSFDPGTNVVDVLVSRLRDKVDEGFDTRLIHTVRGAGYVLKVD